MQPQRLGDLITDSQHRVEARHRLLKDDADVIATNRAHFSVAQPQQIPALKADRAGDLARRLGNEPQDRHGGDGLAATAFADDRERLTGGDVERDAVDRAVDTVRRPEMRLEVFDF